MSKNFNNDDFKIEPIKSRVATLVSIDIRTTVSEKKGTQGMTVTFTDENEATTSTTFWKSKLSTLRLERLFDMLDLKTSVDADGEFAYNITKKQQDSLVGKKLWAIFGDERPYTAPNGNVYQKQFLHFLSDKEEDAKRFEKEINAKLEDVLN